MTKTTTWMTAATLLLACGGGGADEANGETTTGDETTTEAEVETVAEPEETPPEEPVAPPTGPAHMTVTLALGTDTVSGTVTVVNESGETVAEGPAGQSIEVPAGTYTVRGSATDEARIIGTLRAESTVTLAPGDAQDVRIVLTAARVRLVVTRGGRPVRNARVALIRQGESAPVATITPTSEHIAIQPGRYEADVITGRETIRVTGFTFMEGATQNIPVAIQ
jgi:hypothetical protein